MLIITPKFILILVLAGFIINNGKAQTKPNEISLNGTWDFAQTTKAYPPGRFDKKIPVPGLIHLATPKIDEYDKFFKRPQSVSAKTQHNVYQIDYTPKYNWYRKNIFIADDKRALEAVLNIKKSQYVTQVFVNGIDLGDFIQCYTPINVAITRALKYGQSNEILIKVGDRYWLPSSAAGSTDKEKEHYLPGIWDDVSIQFSDKIHISKILALPDLKKNKISVKMKLWDLNHAQVFFGERMTDTIYVDVQITERKTGREIAQSGKKKLVVTRDRDNEYQIDVAIPNAHAWTPDDPFLYTANVKVYYQNKLSDDQSKNFGMRDFERRGKFFYLNGKRIYLRGSNITLQRFFEDPDCRGLAWDKAWVKKMLIDIPKKLDWNAMRICVGIVPDFWYDMADEYGLLFQNEWFYWQNHGWNEEIKKEYTDWVWSDGSHPSIAIWDAINENYDDYIGNTLIPELKKLDSTRVWDTGFMTSSNMNNDEMDEPHPYMGRKFVLKKGEKPYPLGNLNYKPDIILKAEHSNSAQLVNEYGWVWLWRNGIPSKLTLPLYEHYLGKSSTTDERWQFQAYWLELETEWLRSNDKFAGVLAFCYLTNNYGYTGDWFVGNVKDLKPSPVLYWFKHCFAPVAVFVNLTDERYFTPETPHTPGETLQFNCMGVNDHNIAERGQLLVQILDSNGRIVSAQTEAVQLPKESRTGIPIKIILPKNTGGYLLETEFTKDGGNANKVISRRYLQIGSQKPAAYFDPPIK